MVGVTFPSSSRIQGSLTKWTYKILFRSNRIRDISIYSARVHIYLVWYWPTFIFTHFYIRSFSDKNHDSWEIWLTLFFTHILEFFRLKMAQMKRHITLLKDKYTRILHTKEHSNNFWKIFLSTITWMLLSTCLGQKLYLWRSICAIFIKKEVRENMDEKNVRISHDTRFLSERGTKMVKNKCESGSWSLSLFLIPTWQ